MAGVVVTAMGVVSVTVMGVVSVTVMGVVSVTVMGVVSVTAMGVVSVTVMGVVSVTVMGGGAPELTPAQRIFRDFRLSKSEVIRGTESRKSMSKTTLSKRYTCLP